MEANMDDIKTALDKAAASPDPAVRGMALQYSEARNKLGSLEAFFAFYAEGAAALNGKHHAVKPTAPPSLPTTAAPPRVRPPASAEKKPGTNEKAEKFTQDILSILREADAPVKLETLQQAYEALGKEGPLQSETFRQRMISRQKAGTVVLIPRVGFWLPDAKAGITPDA
jgi:hypothetical protein